MSRPLNGGSFFDFWVDVQGILTPRVTASTATSTVITLDKDYIRYVGATTKQDYNIYVELAADVGIEEYTLETTNPAIATIDAFGLMTHLTDGEVFVRAVADSGIVGSKKLKLTTVGGGVSLVFDDYTTGSLMKHIRDYFNSRMSGISPTGRINTYSGVTRNVDLWLDTVDLGPVSIMAGPKATMVSPIHFISATHWYPGIGTVLSFLGDDNTAYSRTVVNLTPGPYDLLIGLLDAELPVGVTPVKILPSDYLDYFPSFSTDAIPAIAFNNGMQARTLDLYTFDVRGNHYAAYRGPIDGARLEYGSTVQGGDSSAPCFIPINDELVLISCWHHGSQQFGDGPFVTYYKSEINTAMSTLSSAASLGTNYQLTEIDLSGFTSY